MKVERNKRTTRSAPEKGPASVVFGKLSLEAQNKVTKRFWSKVDKSWHGCWIWQGGKDDDGYGRIKISGYYVKAHRLAWQLKYGALSNDCVLHSCDNPSCVRPSHLFEGSRIDNNLDMTKKNRQAVGELQGHSKLTTKDVRVIRDLQGLVSLKELASQYDIDISAIRKIHKRVNWKHVL